MSAEVLHGDCIEVMRGMADASVDAIICDLPYGTTGCKWDDVVPLAPLWEEYARVAKQNAPIVLTSVQPFTTDLINSKREWFKYAWVWVKSQPGDCTNAKNKPMRKHEDVLVFSEGTTANRSQRRMPYFPQGLKPSGRARTTGDNNPGRNGGSFKPFRPSHKPYTQEWTNYPNTVLQFDNERGCVHPTQKPVALMEYLVRSYTEEGATVLDNTCGSGTTGVACVRARRSFVGIERDVSYVETARRRIADAQAQAVLDLGVA